MTTKITPLPQQCNAKFAVMECQIIFSAFLKHDKNLVRLSNIKTDFESSESDASRWSHFCTYTKQRKRSDFLSARRLFSTKDNYGARAALSWYLGVVGLPSKEPDKSETVREFEWSFLRCKPLFRSNLLCWKFLY